MKESIRERVNGRCFGDKHCERRLKWFRRVMMLAKQMNSRTEPKRKFMYIIKKDMRVVGVDRIKWRPMIRYTDP